MGRYLSTLQLAKALKIKLDIPTWEVGSSATNEDVGASPGSGGFLYLDQKAIIAGSYTLYTGGTTSATATTSMTETTHYTLDKTTGKITITAAGHTLIGGTNHVFAVYSYLTPDYGLTDEDLSSIIDRAEAILDKKVNSLFINASATNPSLTQFVEYQASQGWHNRRYRTKKGPIIDCSTTLAEDLDTSETSIDLTSATSFPTAGTIIIDNEIITYTGISTNTLTGCTRGVGDSSAATHTTGAEVHTTIVEISGTAEGTTPTFQTLAWGSEVSIDEEGWVFIYDSTIISLGAVPNLLAQQDVENRIKLTYYYGYDTIPENIVRATIVLCKQQLANDTIDKSLIGGMNEFRPELLELAKSELQDLLADWIRLPMGNT